MIEHEDQLKLQSYLDGELPEAQAREIAQWLARDPEAAALSMELNQTREALAQFEEGVKLPESREFFWSKVQKDIQRLERPAHELAPMPWFVRVRRLLVPATGLALIGLLALTVTREGAPRSSDGSVETALEDSGAFTYHDYSAGATLVWLSYPADNEIADDDDLNSLD